MAKLTIEQCPETGICSIVKEDGKKIDLMPDEAAHLRDATDAAAIKAVLAEVDNSFADSLAEDEVQQLTTDVK